MNVPIALDVSEVLGEPFKQVFAHQDRQSFVRKNRQNSQQEVISHKDVTSMIMVISIELLRPLAEGRAGTRNLKVRPSPRGH